MLTWIIGGVAAAVVVRIAVKSQKKLRTPNVETGNNSQTEGLQKEKKHRKLATELKCQKRFREAALEMWRSFEALQEIGLSPTLANLYRYPRYLFMVGDYEKCATFCELMAIGKPFGNVGAGNDDCQRTRMFYSLAAEAYEKTGDVSNAERCWQRVENAGSDNQIYVDRAVADYLAGGYTMLVCSRMMNLLMRRSTENRKNVRSPDTALKSRRMRPRRSAVPLPPDGAPTRHAANWARLRGRNRTAPAAGTDRAAQKRPTRRPAGTGVFLCLRSTHRGRISKFFP